MLLCTYLSTHSYSIFSSAVVTTAKSIKKTVQIKGCEQYFSTTQFGAIFFEHPVCIVNRINDSIGEQNDKMMTDD